MGVLQLYWQLFDSNFLGTGTVLAEESTWRWVSCRCIPAAVWQQFPRYWHRIGRRKYLEVGLLQLYWQLLGSNFLGTDTVLAEENTWSWVSCSCTGSCLTAISLVLALYWQLFGSNFLGTGNVLAEESTWRWVSCSCTGSCLAAISLVPALYWQKS
jgi:hypothetical protein